MQCCRDGNNTDLFTCPSIDYKFCQGHGIFGIHPSHRGTAVSGGKHLARTSDEKFAGLDKLSFLVPPGAELIAHLSGHAPGDGEIPVQPRLRLFFPPNPHNLQQC